ncbi:glycerol-3-phosphate cytidylyltransferase [Quadrisphaera granulorum]|uniref:Glycerol-3-phosphate cytidylyltransferase n=1 Tax=Quadrisphaera granulorum TaxID=317664 RepID=A0A316AFA9_9ACTN|nr:adenylyltransferase/cytidyltransferase family protein [Quadrisphaera granulorum]PWJ56049.1 glycerol-3-phosphate cytidylyltransferase [Quadrisphaera granulorum]SZE94683.1 glycerol-3-phosphate cytidylyltransferase [Quadrisphaera granulorum]
MSVIGYVPGVYDMFHIGHLNILRRAREGCDLLVVGAVTDDVVERTKGKRPVVPLTERMEILASVGIVDRVVADDCGSDKLPMWQRLHFDILFKGDDWKGTPKGDQLEAGMAAVGARVVYFPYTETTSSTLLRELITAHG